jgi:drug/metabolite transporter (DMT)-like permease
MAAGPQGARVWGALWIVYVVWGSTYLAIKWGVESWPPFSMLAIRFLVAGTLLFAWCSRRGLPRTTRHQWASAAVVGILLAAVGNGGVGWAETRIDSGLAALIVAIVPLWVAILDRVFLGGRLTVRAVAGIAVGLVGVAFLVDPGGASGTQVGAAVLLLGAAFAWAAGSVYASRAPWPEQPLVGVAMQMLAGGVVLAAMGAGEWSRIDPGAIAGRSWAALAYLIVVGSVVGYSAYGWLLQKAPPQLVSTYAYVNPVVAVLLGALLAGEAVTVHTVVGGAVIVVAVVLIVSARPKPPAAAEPAYEPLGEAA